nr:MAG TPA: hypothetical protein [Caudoviricetes sp.]
MEKIPTKIKRLNLKLIVSKSAKNKKELELICDLL